MSECTEIPPLDPVAFVAALFLAPLLFTLVTFWVVLIPVGALIIGGLPYLILGTPVLLAMLLYGPCTSDRMAKAALITVAIPFTPALLATLFVGGAGLLAVFGTGLACMIFAAGWATTFAGLYNRFYRNPVI